MSVIYSTERMKKKIGPVKFSRMVDNYPAQSYPPGYEDLVKLSSKDTMMQNIE